MGDDLPAETELALLILVAFLLVAQLFMLRGPKKTGAPFWLGISALITLVLVVALDLWNISNKKDNFEEALVRPDGRRPDHRLGLGGLSPNNLRPFQDLAVVGDHII